MAFPVWRSLDNHECIVRGFLNFFVHRSWVVVVLASVFEWFRLFRHGRRWGWLCRGGWMSGVDDGDLYVNRGGLGLNTNLSKSWLDDLCMVYDRHCESDPTKNCPTKTISVSLLDCFSQGKKWFLEEKRNNDPFLESFFQLPQNWQSTSETSFTCTCTGLRLKMWTHTGEV